MLVYFTPSNLKVSKMSPLMIVLFGMLGWMVAMSSAESYTVSGTTSCMVLNNETCVKWSYDIQMDQKSSCFSGNTWVHSRNGLVQMKDLQPGMEVLVYKSGEFVYDSVYMFLHVDSRPLSRTMYQICTQMDCITISHDHILFVGKTLDPMMVSNLRVGQVLYTLEKTLNKSGVFLPIISIQKISSMDGIYAPATHSGTILVNSIVSSVYATTTWQSGAHASMFPVRMYYAIRTWMGYPHPQRQEGIHTYPSTLYRLFGGMISNGKLSESSNSIHFTNSSLVNSGAKNAAATSSAVSTSTSINTRLLMFMLNWPHVF